MTRTVVTRARLLTGEERWPSERHLVVSSGVIEAVLPAGEDPPEGEVVLDAGGSLVIPGLFNAHAHNHELYLKGRLYGMPLEPYILHVSPASRDRVGLHPEELYDRTLASCAEMLRNGITGVADDHIHPSLGREDVEAVLSAYEDAGMRARVSCMVEDAPWRRSVPYEGEAPPGNRRLDALKDRPEAALRAYRTLVGEWGPGGRVGLMVSPSAPQRCSPGFLEDLVHLAREEGLPFHVHIQETLSQHLAGPVLFQGRSMVRFMSDQGLLGPETTVAHAVWIDDEDLRRIAGSGASVVHNPVSNLKLGSGVARVREMLEAGVNVALGTDGLTCNDALDLFEVAKAAALLSCIASTDPSSWLAPREVLSMATAAGARANRFEDVGAIAPGQRADLVFLDSASFALTPRNDAAAQTVFSVRARDVLHVMVDGKVVVRDGRCTTVDARAVNERVAAAAERYLAGLEEGLAENLELLPGVERAYAEAVERLPADGLYRLVPPAGRRGPGHEPE